MHVDPRRIQARQRADEAAVRIGGEDVGRAWPRGLEDVVPPALGAGLADQVPVAHGAVPVAPEGHDVGGDHVRAPAPHQLQLAGQLVQMPHVVLVAEGDEGPVGVVGGEQVQEVSRDPRFPLPPRQDADPRVRGRPAGEQIHRGVRGPVVRDEQAHLDAPLAQDGLDLLAQPTAPVGGAVVGRHEDAHAGGAALGRAGTGGGALRAAAPPVAGCAAHALGPAGPGAGVRRQRLSAPRPRTSLRRPPSGAPTRPRCPCTTRSCRPGRRGSW